MMNSVGGAVGVEAPEREQVQGQDVDEGLVAQATQLEQTKLPGWLLGH